MAKQSNVEDKPLTRRDWLAMERTKLANERTFLAYFRTALVMLGTAVTILKIDFFEEIRVMGWIFLGVAPAFMLIGIWRTFRVRRLLRRTYTEFDA